MKLDEIVSKSESFANSFIKKLSDNTEQTARKQAYFLDNQEELSKIMNALQTVVTTVRDNEGVDHEADILVQKAEDIINRLRSTITEFQKELSISEDVTDEDTTVQFTEKAITDAMKNNKTVQEIATNMNAIAEQQRRSASIPYNYAIICDGQITMLNATTKQTLNDSINAVANSGNYKNIELYEMKFTPVPLQKKTILSV